MWGTNYKYIGNIKTRINKENTERKSLTNKILIISSSNIRILVTISVYILKEVSDSKNEKKNIRKISTQSSIIITDGKKRTKIQQSSFYR